MSFTETQPWEDGFAAVYEREIVPRLGPLEKERKAILARRRRRSYLVAGAAAVILVLVFAFAPGWEVRLIAFAFVAIFGVCGVLVVGSIGQEDFAGRVKAEIMPPIADFAGVRFDPQAGERPDIAPFHDTGLVSEHERARYCDGLAGTHRGVDFSACEASLTRTERTSDSDGKSKTRTVTVFSGVIARFSVPRAAPGTIVIRRDSGRVLNAVFGFFERQFKGLEKVEIPHARFEEAFEVRAEDPAAAREFVTGPFLDALLAIGAGADGEPQPLGAAFVGDRFYLTLSGRELVSVGPVTESLAEIEPRLHRTLAEMRFPHRIIDRFYGV